MLADQVFQSIDCFGFGDIEFHRCLANVEIHLAGRAANVSKIRIRHFTGAIHYAAHDGDLYSFEMRGRSFDFCGCGLQIE